MSVLERDLVTLGTFSKGLFGVPVGLGSQLDIPVLGKFLL